MTRRRWRPGTLVVALVLFAAPACRMTDLTLWNVAEPVAQDACEVDLIRGIAYRTDPAADDYRHRLDLFVPRGRKDFPVVVLVHGGAWVMGDNRCCGLYSSVGKFLASRGIGAVLPNYRLSPDVAHPEHVKDVAKAFAWTRRHIAEYGGRPDQLFLAGHSAGGHLAALLATDERYLKAEKQAIANVRGVIGVSGVYCIPPGKLDMTWGGGTERAFHMDELSPLRGDGDPGPRIRTGLPGLPLRLNIFGMAFGNDPQVRADASPINHVRSGLPPFLLICADNDLPMLPGMAVDFDQALRANGCTSQLLTVEGRNHNSVMFRAVETPDPVAHAIVDFVRRHTAPRAR